MTPKKPAAPVRRLLELRKRQNAAEVRLAELQAQIELALQTFVGSEARSVGKEDAEHKAA